MARINVKPKVEVRARVLVLYDVVRELFEAFGGTDRTGALRRGILDAQLIKSVSFNYYDADDRLLAWVGLTIDWEKHRVLAKTGEGREIEIAQEPGRSVAEQLHRTFGVIMSHTRALRENWGVARVVPSYVYVPDIQRDPARRREADAILGAVRQRFERDELTTPDEGAGETENGFVTFLDFTASKLPELRVQVKHRPPGF